MPFSENSDKLVSSASALVPAYAQKQRRRMLAALVLLLVALLLVFIRDRRFWFPSHDEVDSANPAPSTPAAESVPPAIPAQHKPGRSRTKSGHAAIAPQTATNEAEPVAQAVVTNRAVLPPLQVEVVAGDQHRTVHPGNPPSINVEMQPPAATPADTQINSSFPAPATDASERVRVSQDSDLVVSHQVRPSYPTLARQMKVQGSVILQALIGKDGNIQDLQVSSGPKILASAAMEAVKQWHFKPYYQDGRPVETQCSITVNFTISAQ